MSWGGHTRHMGEPSHCCGHKPLRGDESSVCRSTWFFIPVCSQLDQNNTDTCICRWCGKHHLWLYRWSLPILSVWAIVHKCSCSSPPILPCSLKRNILPYVFLTLMLGVAMEHALAHRAWAEVKWAQVFNALVQFDLTLKHQDQQSKQHPMRVHCLSSLDPRS